MSFFIKDEDLSKPIRTFTYLKKGDGKKAHQKGKKEKFPFLKKGEGKLVSSFHGPTSFRKKERKISKTSNSSGKKTIGPTKSKINNIKNIYFTKKVITYN